MEIQWVRPTLVAQIRFVEWTTDGHLRHASFLGLRTDKSAAGVRRERERTHGLAADYFLSSCSRREIRSVQRDSSVWTI